MMGSERVWVVERAWERAAVVVVEGGKRREGWLRSKGVERRGEVVRLSKGPKEEGR